MSHERIPLRLEGTSLAVRVPYARAACTLVLILAVLAVGFSPLQASAVSRSATVHTLRRHSGATSRAEYRDLAAKMPDWNSYFSGFCVGPETRRVLKDVFALVHNRAVSYLDAHPDANTDPLVAHIKNLGDEKNPLEATVAQLRRGTHAAYVVAVNVRLFGTLFVVSRTAARSKFRLAWDIKTVAERHHRKRDLLGDWANFALCKRPPLTGEVHELPRNRRGQARFYVDAIYNTNGSSALKQLSIWEWRDTHLTPLLMQTYGSTIDGEDVTFANNQLIVRTKEHSRILSSCSSCTDPEGVWTIAVTPDRIIDRGHRYRDPEFPLIDELIYRMAHDMPISDIARPQLAQELAVVFPENQQGKELGVGPLIAWGVSRGLNQSVVYVAGGLGAFLFSVERRESGGYVTGLRDLNACWPVSEGSGLPMVNALAITPTDPPTLLAGQGNGVAKIDYVLERVDLPSTHPSGPKCVRTLAVDPTTPTTVYAAGSSGVFQSTDAGFTWKQIFDYVGGPLNVSDPLLVVGRSNGQSTIYAASVPPSAAAKSTDGGSTWAPAGEGLDARVFSLVADRSASPTLYAGTNRGVFKSADDGGRWYRASEGLSDAPALALAAGPAASRIVYAGTFGEGVFKSSDGGETWAPMNRGLTEKHVNELALAPGDGMTLYAGTEPGLFRSTDGAVTWSAVNTPAAAPVVLALIVDPNNSKRVYAGTARDGILLIEAPRP